jgi:O-antigen ligase
MSKYPKRLFALPMGLVLIDLAVQYGATDPLNPVKFWILGLLAAWAGSDLFSSRQTISFIKSERVIRSFALIISVFTFFFLIAFLATPLVSVGLLGDTGRNLGFLNYLFLALTAMYAAVRITRGNIKNIYWTIFGLNLLFVLYGFMQHFKHDFIKWNNQYNPIILTTGNPDFAASILGLFAVICFAALFADFSKIIRTFLVFLLSATVVLIYWTQARQGLVAIVIGAGFVAVVLVWQKSRRLGVSLLTLEIVAGLFALLGTLQIGPLTKYFYKASINDRGYNWRAALAMFKDHPFFGVGVDRYAAYFLQYRNAKYPLIYGYAQTVTNAHNVFLEIFATAGIFVGLAYIVLNAFIGLRAISAIRSSSGRQQILVAGVVAGWIVFIAQSMISVDSLVISIWGWVLGGAIVGLSLVRKESETMLSVRESPKFGKSTNRSAPSNALFARGVGFAIVSISLSVFVIVPMNRNEKNTATLTNIAAPATVSEKETYLAIAHRTFNQTLLNPNYKEQIAAKLAQNNYGPESIYYFQQTIKSDPRNTNSYLFISLVYENLKAPEKAIPFRQQLAVLDPYGAENLVSLENDYLVTGNRASAIATEKLVLEMAPGTDVAHRAEKLLASKVPTPKK